MKIKTKRTTVITVLALAFAIGAAVPAAFFVLNNSQAYATQSSLTNATSNEDMVADASNAEDLTLALADESVSRIVLQNDIELGQVDIERNNDVQLNLNGHTITGTSEYIFWLKKGNLRITYGTIKGATNTDIQVSGSSVATNEKYSTLLIDEDVTLESTGNSALTVISAEGTNVSYGVDVIFRGHIIGGYGIAVDHTIGNSENYPFIIIDDGASIVADKHQDSTPIYASGQAKWDIKGAVLEGKAAIGVDRGILNFDGTTVRINSDQLQTRVGSVFNINHSLAPEVPIEINIQDGSFTSLSSSVFSDYADPNIEYHPIIIRVEDGSFTANRESTIIFDENIDTSLISLRGGSFRGKDVANLQKYIVAVDGLVIDKDGIIVPEQGVEKTLANDVADFNIAVKGMFRQPHLSLRAGAVASQQFDELFADYKFEAFSIGIFNSKVEDQEITDLPEAMQVSIEVPEKVNGKQSSVYLVKYGAGTTRAIDSTRATKLEASYRDGSMHFITDTLGLFAIVEDGGYSSGGDSNNTGEPDQSGASDADKDGSDKTTDDGKNDTLVPETGVRQRSGIPSAVSTIVPVALGVGVVFAWIGKRYLRHCKKD